MSEGITIDDVEQEKVTPDIVAARCNTYEFGGRKLHPFSKSRQTAATQIGVSAFIGAPPEDRVLSYALDAQKLIWLCWVDQNMINKIVSQPKIAVPLIMDWWDECGVNQGSDAWTEFIETSVNIVQDLETVSATVDGTGTGDGESMGE